MGYNERSVKKALEKAEMLESDVGRYAKTVRVNGGTRKTIVLTLANTAD
jgi:hypothetical protein